MELSEREFVTCLYMIAEDARQAALATSSTTADSLERFATEKHIKNLEAERDKLAKENGELKAEVQKLQEPLICIDCHECESLTAECDRLRSQLRDAEVKYQSDVGCIERYAGGKPISELPKIIAELEELRDKLRHAEQDRDAWRDTAWANIGAIGRRFDPAKVLRDSEAMDWLETNKGQLQYSDSSKFWCWKCYVRDTAVETILAHKKYSRATQASKESGTAK